MSYKFIDKRSVNNRQTDINRKKYIDRSSTTIQEKLNKAFEAEVTLSGKKFSLTLNSEDAIKEVTMSYSHEDGVYDVLLSNNDEYRFGDHLPINDEYSPGPSGWGESDGSEGDGEFQLSDEEIEEIVLGDIRLPDLKPKSPSMSEVQKHKGGFTKEGTPAKLDRKRSYKESIVRRKSILSATQAKINKLKEQEETATGDELLAIQEEIQRLMKIKPPLFEKNDLRYRTHYYTYKQVTKAVIFFMMDTSGSMGPEKRSLAQIGAYVLYRLLNKQYKNIEMVFIKHTDTAKVVSERNFFHSHEAGGTVISSSLVLADDLIREKYHPSNYNIYMMQLTDGENSPTDNRKTLAYIKHFAKFVQQYSFLSIIPENYSEDLLKLVKTAVSDNVSMHTITNVGSWSFYFKDVFHGEIK